MLQYQTNECATRFHHVFLSVRRARLSFLLHTIQGMTTLAVMRPSFFSSPLSPALLALSPLQSILACLRDAEKVNFCCVNKDHNEKLLSRMRMNEYHTLTKEDWNLIQQREGPVVTSIQLAHLTELNEIPATMRCLIKRVRFRSFGDKTGTVIPRESMPPLLEVLSTDDKHTYDLTHREKRLLVTGELPILPSTLKTLILGFWLEDPEGTIVAKMFEQILTEVTNLTELRISVQNPSLYAVLPQSIETLALHMYTTEMPKSWPPGLKHLSIEVDSETDILIDTFLPPKTLESLRFPCQWNYEHYAETMAVVHHIDGLKKIEFGHGVSHCQMDVFALLPQSITSVIFDAGLDDEPRVCKAALVESLPNTVRELTFATDNRTITRWPNQLRSLTIFGQQFAQDLSGLPDTVEELTLPEKFTHTVSKWPNQLKKVALGPSYFSIPSIERLTKSNVTCLTVAIPVARQLMSAGTLPQSLQNLSVYGVPDTSRPFDVRLLPRSVREIVFDKSRASVVGEQDRPTIEIKVVPWILRFPLQETVMNANFAILTDEKMTKIDGSDPEETIGFIPRPGSYESPIEQTPRVLASNQLFYSEATADVVSPVPYELSSHHFTAREALTRLAAATPVNPIIGVSFSNVNTPPLIRALTDALQRGCVVGSLNISNCKSSFAAQYVTVEARERRADGTWHLYETPEMDMIDVQPCLPTKEEEESGRNNDMVELFAAIKHCKFARVEIRRSLKEQSEDRVDVAASSSELSGELIALCASIRSVPTLRTLVLPLASANGMQHLTQTLLSPESAAIDCLELSSDHSDSDSNRMNDPRIFQHLSGLIRQTQTLKYINLRYSWINIVGLCHLAPALSVNRSLVEIYLMSNGIDLPCLHALRSALRQNRTIRIFVSHSFFTQEVAAALRQRRHARLKELKPASSE